MKEAIISCYRYRYRTELATLALFAIEALSTHQKCHREYTGEETRPAVATQYSHLVDRAHGVPNQV
jgi:hypothetical protein